MSKDKSGHKKLGWFLCWAIVFADIGTSLYYVPGILFGEVKNLAGLFVVMSSVVFVLLVMKYIEITDRYPEGGGVVTVATHAFGPWFGALGGIFITVDYFLTASISSVSGFAYLNSILPLGNLIMWFAIIGVILLGILNVIGIKESAGVTALIAVAAFIVDLILVIFVSVQLRPEGWQLIFHSLTQVSSLGLWPILTGFAGSFLAFSGLESISQLSPAMGLPRKKIAGIAMALVVGSILVTSPILTLFSTNLLTAKINGSNETILETVSRVRDRENQFITTANPETKAILKNQIIAGKEFSERFISELGAQFGGAPIKIAVVLTASILLLFAANTAIIGAYHVFIALARQNFLPHALELHNERFDTPHWSILMAVVPPIIIIIATRADVATLGALYAFGLLGAFGLSSLGLDVVRWREGNRTSLKFIVGIITTILVFIAWGTNLYYKSAATVFGGTVATFGMLIAYVMYMWFPHKHPAVELVISKATEVSKDQILVPVYDEFNPHLYDFVADYAKSTKKSVILLYIREFTDILQTVADDIERDEEAAAFLRRAKRLLDKENIISEYVYDATNETASAINDARDTLKPHITILSPHKRHSRSVIVNFLKGNIVEKVLRHKNGQVIIYTGPTTRRVSN